MKVIQKYYLQTRVDKLDLVSVLRAEDFAVSLFRREGFVVDDQIVSENEHLWALVFALLIRRLDLEDELLVELEYEFRACSWWRWWQSGAVLGFAGYNLTADQVSRMEVYLAVAYEAHARSSEGAGVVHRAWGTHRWPRQ